MSDRVGHSERNKMRGKTAMKMNGARILVEELIHQGVRVVCGYPGGAVLDIYNELYLASDRIGHVLAAHEQGAAPLTDMREQAERPAWSWRQAVPVLPIW